MTEGRDRAVSVTLSYVFTLAIVTLLLTGLLVASAEFLVGHREETIRSELRVVGQQVADDLATADRLARAGDDTADVAVSQRLPPDVTGVTYEVELLAGPPARVVLRTTDPVVTVEVRVWVDAGVVASTVAGGEIEVVTTGAGLEVQRG